MLNKNSTIKWCVNTILVHFWSQAWKSVFTNELILDKDLKRRITTTRKCNSSVACLPVVDKGLVLILHAKHCTAHSHWRALWSTDPSQVQKVIHQRRIVNRIPNFMFWNFSFCKHFRSLSDVFQWWSPVRYRRAYPDLYSPKQWVWEVCVCVCCCAFCPGCSSGALCEENTRWSVNPHSVRNAMVTPTERQTHAREADIKCVCVGTAALCMWKLNQGDPTTREKARAISPFTQLIICHACMPVQKHEQTFSCL